MREDLLSLRDLILSATPDNPNVSSSYLLHVNNQKRWHKILARPLWLGNDEEALTGFIGKCVDVHEEQLKLDRLVRQASAHGHVPSGSRPAGHPAAARTA